MKLLIPFAAAICATALGAAPVWDKEPDGVFGIRFGEPFPSSIPDCPPGPPRKLCVSGRDRVASDVLVLRGLPFSWVEVDGHVTLLEGKVGMVSLDLAHDDYAKFAQILIERYGQPTQRETREVVTGLGVKLPSEELSWLGQHVLISYSERQSRIDRSSVLFSDIALTLRTQSSDQKRRKDDSSKL